MLYSWGYRLQMQLDIQNVLVSIRLSYAKLMLLADTYNSNFFRDFCWLLLRQLCRTTAVQTQRRTRLCSWVHRCLNYLDSSSITFHCVQIRMYIG